MSGNSKRRKIPKDFAVFPVPRHSPYSKDFTVLPVYRHCLLDTFAVFPISRNFWINVGLDSLQAEHGRREARREKSSLPMHCNDPTGPCRIIGREHFSVVLGPADRMP